MIKPLSFTSIYKVHKTRNTETAGYIGLIQKCKEQNFKCHISFPTHNEFGIYPEFEGEPYISRAEIIVPDEKDSLFETYCLNNGIKYQKHGLYDLLNPESIKSRIQIPKIAQRKYKSVYVDPEKLSNLANSQIHGNFCNCEKIYNRNLQGQMKFILQTYDKLDMPILDLSRLFGKNRTLEEVKNQPPEKIKPNCIGVNIESSTPNYDGEYLYFAMKNLGMKKIPVCVNESTYELGNILGLFSETDK